MNKDPSRARLPKLKRYYALELAHGQLRQSSAAGMSMAMRRRWRAYWDAYEEHWRVFGDIVGAPDFVSMPEDLRSLTCGAKTRGGAPCKQVNIFNNGRCKFHGGSSTGPRTKRGKRKAAKNGKRPKKKRTP